MKTTGSNLTLSIVTMAALFLFSGCYTELAFVPDQSDYTAYTPPEAPVNDSPVWPYPHPNLPPPPPTEPIYIPMPSPVYTTTVAETPAPSPTRDSGYRRSEASDNRQTADSGRRSSGDRRSR